MSYLLALCRTGKHRPLAAATRPGSLGAFGQCQGLVHGVVRGGDIQVVPMETVGGGGGRDALRGAVIEAPAFVAIVSARMLGS